MEDNIADLYYISEYAKAIREQLKNGHEPNRTMIDRMAFLSEVVQRRLIGEENMFAPLSADYTMTEAEAKALSDTTNPPRPKIKVRSLPPRLS